MSLQQQYGPSRSLAAGAMAPIEKFYRGVYFGGAQRRALGLQEGAARLSGEAGREVKRSSSPAILEPLLGCGQVAP